MNSSGIKRGLATTAVSALAIAGLPLFASPASAAHGTDEVTLISQGAAGFDASVKNDGTDTTIRLEAEVADAANSVVFQYNPDPAAAANDANWVTIATVSADDDGYAAFEWDAAGLVGGTVSLRAQVTETVAGVTETYNSQRSGVTIFGGGAAAESVNIAAGTNKGVFQEPYTETAGTERNVIVNGTTSATAGDVNVYWWNDADDTKQDETLIPVTQPEGSTTGVFAGVLNVDGFDFSGNPDQIAIGAERDTDDVEAYTLYNQVITNVTATPTNATVAGSGTRNITITVTDQNGAPVAGAEVRSQDGGTPFVGYTNGRGQVVAAQDGGTTRYYYANATDSNPFEPGLGDQRTADVTVGQYQPAATSLEATSANGTAFDEDEYDSNDIQIQVVDQQGEDFSTTQVVEYSWTFTAFDGSPAAADLNDPNGFVTTVNGQADIPLPLQAEGGTYTLNASLRAIPASGQGAIAASDVLTIKTGDSDIVFDESAEEAPAGGDEVVSGKLALTDGTPLPNRPIRVTYTSTGDARFDPATGTTDVNPRDTRTGADGSFSVTLDDPTVATGTQPTETGTVTAATQDYTDANGQTDNADEQATNNVTFFQAEPGANATVVIGGAVAAANQLGKPGVAVDGNVTVTLPDGPDGGTDRDPVANQVVTLTVNGSSFFTDGTDESTTNGSLRGDLTSLGQSITVTTNAAGVATFKVAVERSEELDDDGLAEDVVSAAAGSTATDSEDVDYSTRYSDGAPINGGTVEIVPTDGIGQSEALPEARVGETVFFDVFATDQFGNLVGGATVNLTENGAFSSISETTVTTDYVDDVEFEAEATRPNTQVINGSWTAPNAVYGSAAATKSVSDSYTLNWYDADFADSEFTITQSPEGDVVVGSPVTETVRVLDQNGNPVSGLRVEFIRQGAGSAAGGDPAVVTFTNANGEAFYTFTGAEAGTATVSAFITDGVQTQTLTDTVEFVAVGPGEKKAVTAIIAGDDNGGDKDVIRFQVDDEAEGATVRLFKIKRKNGNRRLVEIRQDIVPAGGELTFKIADRNGNRITKFLAKVGATDTTRKAKSNTQKLR